jgi:hypothetical protein
VSAAPPPSIPIPTQRLPLFVTLIVLVIGCCVMGLNVVIVADSPAVAASTAPTAINPRPAITVERLSFSLVNVGSC